MKFMTCFQIPLPSFLYLVLSAGGLLWGDYVELRDGTRIEGRILAEREDGVEIEIGRNDRGTIRRMLIIDASEISSWAADQEGRIPDRSLGEVQRLAGSDYVKRLLADAEDKIRERKFDEGISGFEEAADIAIQHLDQLEGQDKVTALNLRAHALRLAEAALEGKVELIESQTDGVEEDFKDRLKDWEKDWETLEDDKRDFERDTERRKVELGSRRETNDFVKREEALNLRRARLERERATLGPRLQEYELMRVEAEARIEMIKERVDQAEDEAKVAERALRRK